MFMFFPVKSRSFDLLILSYCEHEYNSGFPLSFLVKSDGSLQFMTYLNVEHVIRKTFLNEH